MQSELHGILIFRLALSLLYPARGGVIWIFLVVFPEHGLILLAKCASSSSRLLRLKTLAILLVPKDKSFELLEVNEPEDGLDRESVLSLVLLEIVLERKIESLHLLLAVLFLQLYCDDLFQDRNILLEDLSVL